MMYQSYSIKDQRGAYFPLMVFGVIILLAVGGLSLDAANLYYTKLQYQKAADLAAIAGLNYRVIKGGDTDNFKPAEYADFEKKGFNEYNDGSKCDPRKDTEKAIGNRTREIAYFNLAAAIPAFDNDNVNPSDHLIDEEISVIYHNKGGCEDPHEIDTEEVVKVRINKPRNYFLMNAIPFEVFGTTGFDDEFVVSSRSRASINPLRVFLMLDFSNSMICPTMDAFTNDPDHSSIGGSCEDFLRIKDDLTNQGLYDPDDTSNPAIQNPQVNDSFGNSVSLNLALEKKCYCHCLLFDTCDLDTSKLKELLIGVDIFLEKFQVSKDKIAIIPYNLSSHVIQPITNFLKHGNRELWDVSDSQNSPRVINKTNNYNRLKGLINKSPLFNGPTQITNDLTVHPDSFQIGQWTNHADAFLSAYLHNLADHRARGIDDIEERTYYVFFTDGAPTAARFLLSDNADADLRADYTAPPTSLMQTVARFPGPNVSLAGDITHYSTVSKRFPTRKIFFSDGTDLVLQPNTFDIWKPGNFIFSQDAMVSKDDGNFMDAEFNDANEPNTLYGIVDDSIDNLDDPPYALGNSEAPIAGREETYKDFIKNYCGGGDLSAQANCIRRVFEIAVPEKDNGETVTLHDKAPSGDYFHPSVHTAFPFTPKIENDDDPDQDKKYLIPNGCSGKFPDNAPQGYYYDNFPDTSPHGIQLGELSSEDEPGESGSCDKFNIQASDRQFFSQDFPQLYYNAAIAYADLLRKKNGRVFTIGYGSPDPCGPDYNPLNGETNAKCTIDLHAIGYQNYHDSLSRKDIFLKRLANTEEGINKTIDIGGDGTLDIDDNLYFPPQSGVTSWNEIEGDKGIYIAARDSNELQRAFEEIASLIVTLRD